MGESNSGIRGILAYPEVYRWVREALGLNRWLQRYVEQYVKPREGDRILDIGCGTGEIVRYLRGTTYVGVDHHHPYIDYAMRVFGNRGRFICADVADHIDTFRGEFDLVIANGVLHHLDDALATKLFHIGAMVLSEGGRMVTVDPCYYEGQACATRFIISNDRGQNVRQFEDYARLAGNAFSTANSQLWHGFFPLPFSVAIVECRKIPEQ